MSRARKTAPISKKPIHVLSASTDPGLNSARAQLLRHYGFHVVATESKEEAHEHIERGDFHVLIFGSTLGRDTCWELAAVFRRRNAKGKIIEIVPTPWAAPKNQPDAIVASSDEAEKLITTIRVAISD
jgi:DNA-binding NtrC family response regulator